MKKEEVDYLVSVRTNLVSDFSKLRDYKTNPNAIMKEVDHARRLHSLIKQIDSLLKEYVSFKD